MKPEVIFYQTTKQSDFSMLDQNCQDPQVLRFQMFVIHISTISMWHK